MEGINRLKRLVPVWKKEYFVDGEVWVDGEWDDAVVKALHGKSCCRLPRYSLAPDGRARSWLLRRIRWRASTSDVTTVRLGWSTLKDAHGDLVGSLESKDFTVYDCGVKQDVKVFEAQTELPLSVSVLIDISASTLIDIKYETASIEKFFKALLGSGNPKDAAAVYSFNDSVTLLKNFTRNQGQLDSSIRFLNSEGSTALYDAIVFAARGGSERMGRHVIVIVTDGGDTSSKYKYRLMPSRKPTSPTPSCIRLWWSP